MKRTLFLVGVVLVTMAGCVTIAPTGEDELPTAYIDSISPTEASAGEAVSFHGHGTDPDGEVVAYRWRSDVDGEVGRLASFEISSLSEGTHTIYLKVQDNNGNWSDEVRSRLVISGEAAGPPVVESFTANPASITSGGSATLNWEVVGAETITIDQGIGSVALNGNRMISPAGTTTYTLTATNATGSVSATAQVTVAAAAPPPSGGLPVITSFAAAPLAISAGDPTTLSWSVSNATSVIINPGVGPVASAGSTSVSPPVTASYTLTATNAAGPSSVTITVSVGAAPAEGEPDLVILDVSADGDTIDYTIKNQGPGAAAASSSVLVVDGDVKGFDNVGSLAAGEESTESFAGYSYSCSGAGDTIAVGADEDGVLDESSEANNEYSVNWLCTIFIPPLIVMKPDLVIQDIWLVHEMVADRIYYRIKNEGPGEAGASTTALTLYPCMAPCPPVATDPVDPLAPGEVSEEKFGLYKYTGSGINAGVRADEGDVLDESDEENNSRTEPTAGL